MNRSILIATNDTLIREIAAKFFSSQGFLACCSNLDERLLSHISDLKPDVLLCDVSPAGRFYSPNDFDSVLTLLLAARLRRKNFPILLMSRESSRHAEEQARLFGMTGFFSYPLDLSEMLTVLRVELRRISRLKACRKNGSDGRTLPSKLGRGRPRKYPVLLPVSVPEAAVAVA